jgi:hypothetical protein
MCHLMSPATIAAGSFALLVRKRRNVEHYHNKFHYAEHEASLQPDQKYDGADNRDVCAKRYAPEASGVFGCRPPKPHQGNAGNKKSGDQHGADQGHAKSIVHGENR